MPVSDLLELSFDPACLADSNGKLTRVNEAFLDMQGAAREAALSMTLQEMIGQAAFQDICRNAATGRVLLRRIKAKCKGGESLPVEARSMLLERTGEIALVFRPTAASVPSEGAEHMALHDALTGLPNRVLLLDRLSQTLARARRHGDFAAVVFIDLDGFKPINDTYGHECGDEVLKVTASRLLEVLRGDDTAARIGGDEFVMVLGELKKGLHAGITGNRVIKAITRPIPWREGFVGVSASLGISVAPTDGMEPDELLKKADEAMYVAKKSGKNGYAFFNESSYFE
ncbi:MAG: diguanylate cyclase domain-containing protein [Thermodesulfobacteriota bacterium]